LAAIAATTPQVMRSSWSVRIGAGALALLLIFAAMLIATNRAEIKPVEARLLWIIEDQAVDKTGVFSLRQTARLLLDNALVAFERTRAGAHPPLYPLLLDTWTAAAGGGLLTARILSSLLALLGLSLSAACLRWADRHFSFAPVFAIGLVAPLAWGAAQHAEPLALLFTLGALAHLAFLRWLDNPTPVRTILYGLALVAAFYAHYAALLLITLHGLILLLQRRSIALWLITAAFAVTALAAWVYAGVRADNSAVIPLSEWISGGLLLILPLAALGVRHLAVRQSRLTWAAGIALVMAQIASLVVLFTAQPPWREIVTEINALRHITEPALISVRHDTPLGYYVRSGELQRGIALDISWRDHTAAEIAGLIDRLTRGDHSVWLIMPADNAETQIALDILSESRSPGWQRIEDGMLFYRFDLADRG
jgi:hypothetical protein